MSKREDLQFISKKVVLEEVGFKEAFRSDNWEECNKQFFNQLAPKYDATNLLHSFGGKKIMDKSSVARLPIEEILNENKRIGRKTTLLDLCTGSGDLAIIMAKKFPEIDIIGVDQSLPMLKEAEKKIAKLSLQNITLKQGDALKLSFEENTFDGALISFGLRNLSSPLDGLKEMIRVVRPLGFIANIDLGKPNSKLLKLLHSIYFLYVAPFLGKIVFHQNEYNSFNYLAKSSKFFPSQNKLSEILSELGLKEVKNYNYYFGGAAMQLGRVPIEKGINNEI